MPKDLHTGRHRIEPGQQVRLSDIDPNDTSGFDGKDEDEQKKRLQQRLEDPSKRWKFSGTDLPERRLWKEYMKAYEDVLNKTSTEWAPWYSIPANHKWYRDLVVSRIIVKALEKLNLRYPKIDRKSVPSRID